eukprot:17274-Pelagococcus_subviridis.AAC.1
MKFTTPTRSYGDQCDENERTRERLDELVLRHRSRVVRVEQPPREVHVLALLLVHAELREADDELVQRHVAVAADVEERHEPRKEDVRALDVEKLRELSRVDAEGRSIQSDVGVEFIG